MRKKLSIILLTMTATLSATAQALQGDSIGNDTLSVTTQMSQTDHLLKYPVRALGEVTILNGIIHGLNRYVLNEAYAQTTLKSIRRMAVRTLRPYRLTSLGILGRDRAAVYQRHCHHHHRRFLHG